MSRQAVEWCIRAQRAERRTAALEALLTEAMGHITDKPWDDPTKLHQRISAALGLQQSYPDQPCIDET